MTNPTQPDQLAHFDTHPAPLSSWVSIPAVLVAGPAAMQNSPFSSLTVAVTIASTHCAYPRRDGWLLAQIDWLHNEMVYLTEAVTDTTTIWARCRATFRVPVPEDLKNSRLFKAFRSITQLKAFSSRSFYSIQPYWYLKEKTHRF